MAFNQKIAFEVDSGSAGASDSNGGGFDDTTGVPGTNYVWPTPTIIAYTDLTSVGAGSTATSVSRAFIAADVGNVLNIASGTNFTAGRYQILSVSSGTATFDRACTIGAGISGTGTLGGALLTIQKGIDCAFINTGAVADCRVYIKKGTYTSTVALTTASSVAGSNFRCRVIGYNTSHDDTPLIASGNQPTFAVGAGAGVNGVNISTGAGFEFMNITFIGTVSSGTAGVIGFNSSGGFVTAFNCKFIGFSSSGVKFTSAYNGLCACEIVSCGGSAGTVDFSGASNGQAIYNWIHKNSGPGLAMAPAMAAVGNLITNNTGPSSDGIRTSYSNTILYNTIYGNGRDGIRTGANYEVAVAAMWRNNIIAKCAGAGIDNISSTGAPNVWPQIDYNAFYANTGSNYANLTGGLHDVIITVPPFVSSDANLVAETSPDWTLNGTVAAGMSLRGAGFPGAMPGMTIPLGVTDIGTFQVAGPPQIGSPFIRTVL